MNIVRNAMIAAAMLTVVGCAGFGPAPSLPIPSEVADKTAIDEQAATGFNLAYTAAARSAVLARKAGLISAAQWPKVKAMDNRAYAALQGVRAAYRAGNAADIAKAVEEARIAFNAFISAAQ